MSATESGGDPVSGGGLSLRKAARRVGVSEATLRRWARDGVIPQSNGNWTPAVLGHARVVARMRERGHSLAPRLTEEEGELQAVDSVERFVEAVETTLPDDARVIKTIGDEVMVVGSDPAGLTDWAVAFQLEQSDRPLPRIGIHSGVALYRDGDYYGRDVNIASRVARARPAARCS
jgi:adenylate cyclase